MDLKDLAIKYLEAWALQRKTKEELLAMVLELQTRDKSLVDLLMKSVERGREKDKKLKDLENRLAATQLQSEEYKRVADLKLGNTYNINATWVDKIVFVLKATGRPLRSSEIISVLFENDPLFRTMTDHQKGLSAHLTKALKYGRIVGVKEPVKNFV
jgi:carboxypeptidase C (cathepsin A)